MATGASQPALSRGKAIVLSSVLGLLALVLFLVFVIRLASSSGGNALGDPTFDANAAALARRIAGEGPVLFQDLLGGGKDIYVQHLGGDDVRRGWHAFRATAPDAERRCTLQWDGAARVFRDVRCGTGATFPADGAGLESYSAVVEEGSNKLVVDLKRPPPPPTTAP